MEKNNSIEEAKINYYRVALGMADIGVDNYATELILEIVSLVDEKGGKATIEDAVAIKCRIKAKYDLVEIEKKKKEEEEKKKQRERERE